MDETGSRVEDEAKDEVKDELDGVGQEKARDELSRTTATKQPQAVKQLSIISLVNLELTSNNRQDDYSERAEWLSLTVPWS